MNVETSDGERSAGYSSWLSIGDILFNKTQQPKIDKLTFPKQTVNTFTQTHTHTHFYVFVSRAVSALFTPVKKWKACALR